MRYHLKESLVTEVPRKYFLICQNQNVLLTGLFPAFSQGPALQMENMEKPVFFPTNLLTAPRPCRARLWPPPLCPLSPSLRYPWRLQGPVWRLPGGVGAAGDLPRASACVWGPLSFLEPSQALRFSNKLQYWVWLQFHIRYENEK